MVSHRYDRLPLLPSGPGGIKRELVVPDSPVAKVMKSPFPTKQNFMETVSFAIKDAIGYWLLAIGF